MHPSLQSLAHRPWPLPTGSWKWRQSWLDLAFLHYRVSATVLQDKLPEGLELDTFDGNAWVSVVPFRMADVARGKLPSVPPLRSFPELNLRTYVTHKGKPGVWFFSLDADCWPLVWGGRALYSLPYLKAKMSLRRSDSIYAFTSLRRAEPVAFIARYRPTGPVFFAKPDTFEHWSSERYCLYAFHRNGLQRTEVHHTPWPVQRAEIEVEHSDILKAAGIAPLDEEPVTYFTTGVDVISF